MKTLKQQVLHLARAKFGPTVIAYGHLNTVSPASGPYRRDGRKEFHALVEVGKQSQRFIANRTAPTADEAWQLCLADLEKLEALK
jgi:hypothetical protein